MKNKDLFSRTIKNILRNKINILNIFLLSISISIIIFGFSYITSIKNLWLEWTQKSFDFRMYYVTYDFDKLSEDEAINKLKEIDGIQKVIQSSAYNISVDAIDYHSDKMDGQFYLRGATSDGIKIVNGENLENYSNKNVLICATKFNPDSQIYQKDFSKQEPIDLNNKIGDEINLKVAESGTEKFKIVGLYDATNNFSAGDICYTSFETIKRLNLKYQPEVYENKKGSSNESNTYQPLFIVINDVNNFNSISEIMDKNGFYAFPVTTINTKVGNNIIKIMIFLTIIFCALSLIIIGITTLKRIEERKKEYALYKAIGYSSKDINLLIYSESSLVGFISFIFSFLIGIIALYFYRNVFLISNVEFSNMSIKIDLIGILVSFIFAMIIPFISSYFGSKKIEEIEIINILKD